MDQLLIAQARDFDFQIGKWQVRHRRLKRRLEQCTEWEEFSGQSEMRLSLGGLGNLEQNVLNIVSGSYHAIAIRAFDPASGTWAIWWLDGRSPHALDVPVIGSFKEGIGEFTAVDVISERPVLVRFLWLKTATATPRWEQAMSLDQGATWETNWTMDFSRD